jgi:catechol 2,3-dioxygenase-like lactoylglutathione lyase family enzyme
MMRAHNELTLVVYARDFARTVDFYDRMLELRPIDRWDRDESKGARFSAGSGAVLEIHGAPGAGIDEQTRVAGVFLGLKVDDVDGWYRRLRAQGIDCTEPVDEWWGGRVVYFFDPNGLPVHMSGDGPSTQ